MYILMILGYYIILLALYLWLFSVGLMELKILLQGIISDKFNLKVEMVTINLLSSQMARSQKFY